MSSILQDSSKYRFTLLSTRLWIHHTSTPIHQPDMQCDQVYTPSQSETHSITLTPSDVIDLIHPHTPHLLIPGHKYELMFELTKYLYFDYIVTETWTKAQNNPSPSISSNPNPKSGEGSDISTTQGDASVAEVNDLHADASVEDESESMAKEEVQEKQVSEIMVTSTHRLIDV